MSWYIKVEDVPFEEFEAALDKAVEEYNIADVNPDGVEPLALAVKQAKEAFASGLVVLPGHTVDCTLSGHSNPGHQPRDGWSNDCFTVQVAQHYNWSKG